jgi:hypothetical protein
MDPRDPFHTDEFLRYAAECRRLARLARVPDEDVENKGSAAYLRSGDWMGQLRALYADHVRRHPVAQWRGV